MTADATIRVEVGREWAEVADLRRLNFGEVRRLRAEANNGTEDGVLHVAAKCIRSWEAYDAKTDERLGEPTLAELDRTTPAFAIAVINAVAEGLASALPLGTNGESSKNEPSPS